MNISYDHVLCSLPVDTTLRSFLVNRGLVLPADFGWANDVEVSRRLLDAIQNASVAVRDCIAADLGAGAALDHEGARQAMIQAIDGRVDLLLPLLACRSDLHRSFWLYTHHPRVFEQALDLDTIERHPELMRQHHLGVRAPVRRDAASVEAFCAAIQAFYRTEMGCGEACIASVLDRPGGTVLVSVHAQDLTTVQLEFEGAALTRHVGCPAIHLVLEYAPGTGVARTLVDGGVKFHELLVRSFARHLLGVDLHQRRLQTPAFDLNRLTTGLSVARDDTFLGLGVAALMMQSPDGRLRFEAAVTPGNESSCLTALLPMCMPVDNPLGKLWQIGEATLEFYRARPGRRAAEPVRVCLGRGGTSNLHAFDISLRTQIETLLTRLGVVTVDQALAASVAGDPAERFDWDS